MNPQFMETANHMSCADSKELQSHAHIIIRPTTRVPGCTFGVVPLDLGVPWQAQAPRQLARWWPNETPTGLCGALPSSLAVAASSFPGDSYVGLFR